MSAHLPRDTKPLPRQNWLKRLSTRSGLALLASISVLLIALSVFGGLYVSTDRSPPSSLELEVTPPVSLGDLATQFPKLAPLLNDNRLDSIYKDYLIAYQEGGAEAAYDLAKRRGLLNDRDELVLTLELDTTDVEPLKLELEARGIKVTAMSGNLMDVAVALELIERSIDSDAPGGIFNEIAGLEHVQWIRLPTPSGGNRGIQLPLPDPSLKGFASPLKVGDVDSESLPLIGAIDWQKAGFTGKGIKVGILDKGFDKYVSFLGRDLPASIVGRSFVYGEEIDGTGTVHGTAVAEIVHDIAPDAELFFAPYGTDVEMEQAVNWLLSQGVDIIQNSTGYIRGPFDGSSARAKLVDRVVDSGVLWVNASGNAAQGHYRGTFTDEDGNGFHEFVPGKDLMPFVVPTGPGMIYLNWDDWEQGLQDFDLYIFDADQNKIASSRNTQNGPGSSSVEGVLYEFSDNGPYYAAFYAVNATRAVTFDFFVWDGVVKIASAEHSVLVPADARRALTVGGVNWEDDVLEDYSSQGPTQDARLKPELVAPTRVTSVAYGKAWTGTSASAPHVSGAAALVMQAFPDYGPDQVIEFLEARAVELGPSGPENAYGYGRLWLGYGPEEISVPAPTEQVGVPTPEEIATLSTSETATPTHRHTATPTLSEDEGVGFSLGLLVCVVLPGLLGLGGIGLLGLIIFHTRAKPIAGIPYAMPAVPPVSPPAVHPEPWISPKVEGGYVCPRCGSAHRPQARFCTVCGFALQPAPPPVKATVYCRYCGQSLRSTSKFCTRCGRPR